MQIFSNAFGRRRRLCVDDDSVEFWQEKYSWADFKLSEM